MSSLIAGIEPGFEPIAGYVLREKIGSGGYGEVWLADAPGGLQKAVKIVYGTVDERAGGELRALQRIRSVHHPFILSLERIEVVENQLIVVTELADGTLLDRFCEYQQRGLVGIPRSRLLEYLRDTADALDFLCQKHELQHLDVKPANLLLVADRVKVADFGLIKDIQNKSMSMMSGMTPTYAAPEMFDGRPGRTSDQYSLAIVYQEMLTGSLPFQGRTTAQLATEHLQKAPNLENLPLNERPIVAKALSKKPSQRYSSCREFIDQLIQVPLLATSASPSVSPKSNLVAPSRQTPRYTGSGSSSVSKVGPKTQSWASTQAVEEARSITLLPPLEIPSQSAGTLAPCYFIGLGETGTKVLCAFRKRLQASGLNLNDLHDIAWSAIDTDDIALNSAIDPATDGSIAYQDVLHLGLRPAADYRQRDEQLYTPLSRRWLYNVPRSGKTEGVRPMAMLALLDHSMDVYHFLRNRVEGLLAYTRQQNIAKPTRVYLVASPHGATGSVLSIELAFMIRQIVSELGLPHNLQLVLSVGEQSDGVSTELATASATVCLQEIWHYFKSDGLHPGIPGLPSDHSASPPWRNIYLVPGGKLGRLTGWQTAIQHMTDFLCVDACTALGETLDQARDATRFEASEYSEREWQPWLRMFSTRKVDLHVALDPEALVKRVMLYQVQEWLSALNSQPQTPVTGDTATKHDQEHAANVRIPNPQIDIVVSDLFREQHWSAQSWVRQCMEYLVPKSIQSTSARKTSQSISKQSVEVVPPDLQLDELELDQVCHALGISIDDSRRSARALLDRSDEALNTWMHRVVSNSLPGIAKLPELLQAIARRFTSQSESLITVADRLVGQRDELTRQLHHPDQRHHGGLQSDLAQQEIAQQIRSLGFQAAIHGIAGRMLRRLAESVNQRTKRWDIQAAATRKILREWFHRLSVSLELAPDTDGCIRDVWVPIPKEWHSVRDDVFKVTAQSLRNMIQPGLVGTPALPKENEGTPSTAEDSAQTLQPASDLSLNDDAILALLEQGKTIAFEAATRANLISENSPEENAGSAEREEQRRLDKQMLSAQMESLEPGLLGNGAAIRKLLLLPADEIDEDSLARIESGFVNQATVVELNGLDSAILCIDGERMDLADLIQRFWTPSPDRDHLAERLRSRNDLEWLSIGSLS